MEPAALQQAVKNILHKYLDVLNQVDTSAAQKDVIANTSAIPVDVTVHTSAVPVGIPVDTSAVPVDVPVDTSAIPVHASAAATGLASTAIQDSPISPRPPLADMTPLLSANSPISPRPLPADMSPLLFASNSQEVVRRDLNKRFEKSKVNAKGHPTTGGKVPLKNFSSVLTSTNVENSTIRSSTPKAAAAVTNRSKVAIEKPRCQTCNTFRIQLRYLMHEKEKQQEEIQRLQAIIAAGQYQGKLLNYFQLIIVIKIWYSLFHIFLMKTNCSNCGMLDSTTLLTSICTC